MKLLSICIPTYNRAKFLLEALSALEKAIPKDKEGLIELVISNNCSTDETKEIIDRFLNKNLSLESKVVHQIENIGPKNTAVVSSYATGKFIWIVSDDDIILPNSLEKILSILEKSDHINGIIINYAGFEKDPLALEKSVLSKQDGVFDKNSALKHLCTSITFISALVYRQEKVFLHEKFLNNNLPHSFLFLQAMNDGNIYSYSENVLAMRMENSGGYDFYEVFLKTFNEVLYYANTLDYDENSIESVRKRHLRNHVTVFSIIFKSNKYYGKLKMNKFSAFNMILNYNRKDFYTKILAIYILTPDFLSIPVNYLRILRRKILNMSTNK